MILRWRRAFLALHRELQVARAECSGPAPLPTPAEATPLTPTTATTATTVTAALAARRPGAGQDAASEIRAQQQAVFNSMVEGVLVLDASGRVQMINASLQRLFGLPGDVRGQTILEAFRLQELSDLVQRLASQPTLQSQTLELPGLEERWVEVNAAAVSDAKGEPLGAILVFHDLTRIKHLERTRQEFVALTL